MPRVARSTRRPTKSPYATRDAHDDVAAPDDGDAQWYSSSKGTGKRKQMPSLAVFTYHLLLCRYSGQEWAQPCRV